MKPHPRIRKVALWGGAVGTVLISGMWLVSWWFYFAYMAEDWAVGLEHGGLTLRLYDSFQAHYGWEGGWQLPPRYYRWWFGSYRGNLHLEVVMPLWPVLGLTMITATVGMLSGRWASLAARKGLCPNCNYNRASLAPTAVCPECGAPPPSDLSKA